MGNFEFNGKSTKDMGLVIQTPPTYTYPERDLSTVHVPGRNGDLIIDNNCYKNVERSYSVGKGFKPGTNYSTNSADLIAWLTSANGKYVRLRDSYDSEVYRMAMFNMSGSTTNIWDGALSCTISFQCKPQRYLLSGEEEFTYNPELQVENPSVYTALPDIILHDIGDVAELGKVLMLSIINNDSVVSNLNINYYTGSLITIKSEDQKVIDENQNNIGEYIGLNGKPFPQFKAGLSKIKLEKFLVKDTNVPSYNSIIKKDYQTIIISEYKNYTAIETQKQEKYTIPSYQSLVESEEEVYPAEAVQSMIMDKCNQYTFKSYNDILSQYGEVYAFTGTIADNEASCPKWIKLESDDGDKIKLVVGVDDEDNPINGFFFVKNVDKKIKFCSENSVIAKGIGTSSVTTVYYYKAIPDINRPGKYALEANYIDMPDEWLSFKITYDNDDSPSSISYVTKAEGYYWTDKTWIFGQAQWKWYAEGANVVLNTLQWNTSKQAFVTTSGLTTSTTTTFTYKYIPELPQYDPITIEEDKNGKKVVRITNKVHFTIEDLAGSDGKTLSNIQVKALDTGFYSYDIGEKTHVDWVFKTAGSSLISGTSLKGTSAFTIYYLEAENQNDVPDYSKIKEWPKWLSRIPVKTGGSPLSPTRVCLTVLKDAYYRHTIEDDEGNETYSEWEEYTAGELYDSIDASDNTTYSMCMIEEIPSTYVNDRAFTNEAKESSALPPSWLSYQIFIEIILDDAEDGDKIVCYRNPDEDIINSDDETLSYYAYTYTNADDEDVIVYIKGQWNPDVGDYVYLEDEQSEFVEIGEVAIASQIRYFAKGTIGYYKWDNNSAWAKKVDGDELLVTSAIDDTTFYYMSEIPEFADYDLFYATVRVDNFGNPDLITFRVKEGASGYFRCNNNSDWTYLEAHDELLISKVGDSNTIRYLEPTEEDLSSVTITYIPRWWIL